MRIIIEHNSFDRVLNAIISEEIGGEINNSPSNKTLYRAYYDKIEATQEQINNIVSNGKKMMNIHNGKTYMVYYDSALSNASGKSVGICRLLRNNETYGSVYVRPMSLFKQI
jgi:predicted DNA binding protein